MGLNINKIDELRLSWVYKSGTYTMGICALPDIYAQAWGLHYYMYVSCMDAHTGLLKYIVLNNTLHTNIKEIVIANHMDVDYWNKKPVATSKIVHNGSSMIQPLRLSKSSIIQALERFLLCLRCMFY